MTQTLQSSAETENLGAVFESSDITRRTALRYLGRLGMGALATWLSACAPEVAPQSPTPRSPVGNGTISIYSVLNETTNREFIAAFKAATPGMEVKTLPLAAAGDLQARIRNEKNSPQADIFVGGSSEYHSALASEGLLQPYKSPNAAFLDPRYLDPDGYWTGWYIGIFGFVFNTDRFAKEMAGIRPPATWDDLLDPMWKGKLVLPDPARTGGGFIFLATQVFRFNRDETKAIEYMKALHGNIDRYVGTAMEGIQLVGGGQYVGCPNWAHDIITAKSQGQPVELVVPKLTGFEVGAVSIVKGGQNLEGAKKFVDWVLTRDAGKLNVKLSNRLSTRDDVVPAFGAPTLGQVSLVDYDRVWASSQQQRLIKEWQTATS